MTETERDYAIFVMGIVVGGMVAFGSGIVVLMF
jgi:hypothetical protein